MSASTPLWAGTDRALDEALDRVDEHAARLVELLQQQIAAYGGVPAGDLHEGVAGDLRRGLLAMRQCRGPNRLERAQSAAVGSLRAQQGVPVEQMFQAFQLCVEELLRTVGARARELGAPDAELLEITQGAWAWANFTMTAAAREHRHVDLEAARRDLERRAEFVRALLTGAVGPAELAVRVTAFHLDPAGRFRALRARATEEPALEQLRTALAQTNHDRPGAALAVIEGDLAGVVGRLPRDLPEGVIVAVGALGGLSDVSSSFAAASRALETAAAFGLSGVHDLDSLGLRLAVHEHPVAGDTMHGRHLAPLPEGPIVETLKVLLDCHLHVDSAAQKLLVHPNTVRKRIARYQELTGSDLRRTDDVVELWWALRRAEDNSAR